VDLYIMVSRKKNKPNNSPLKKESKSERKTITEHLRDLSKNPGQKIGEKGFLSG
jgi:hypothetical protein